MSLWGPLAERYEVEAPRKLLAIDGGGVRGIVALEVLCRMEELLARRRGGREGFRLCDFFDYVAGTSTGSVIAAGLARGYSARDLLEWYLRLGDRLFGPTALLEARRDPEGHPINAILQEAFGVEANLFPEHLRCLLLVVVRNATTDSPWPVSSNPLARYNDPSRPDCNLKIPLWRLVRASTAYPNVFAPEEIAWDSNDPSRVFVFDDGGVSPYINPAFLLYRLATQAPYRLSWKKGERDLLLVSVGTGIGPDPGAYVYAPEGGGWALDQQRLLDAVLYSAQVDQDISCRTVGRCVHGAPVDRELGDLIPCLATGAPLSLDEDLGRAFLYARYNAELSPRGLEALGLGDAGIDVGAVKSFAAVDHIDELRTIGRSVAAEVSLEHFGPFVEATSP